ncbi:retropepsin-like aspartic protease family protein [Qipengyuania oceanensis]|uniref:TIGR02281 family clan AA aspartic protease n=1 Tax=Qipengyuania oceanensis TaxID=1463597 RepID=A0A844YEX4_9SPHN|nr:TIGR02281 family clan AA aspartic protease [Qipengyuania oceanensis]MXO62095.1 TIGR02281 family clan AA aspartic protease [Qipengyuania oceanensis]
MELREIWAGVAELIGSIPRTDLLWLALASLVLGWIGAALMKRSRVLGRLLGGASTAILVGILVTIVLQMSRLDPRIDLAVPELGLPPQVVEGDETRVPMAQDGHFWLKAEINGVPAEFLVDTGATLTAVNEDLALEAGLEPRRGGIPIMLNTANGQVTAQIAPIEELRFGNVAARGLDAVIAPNLGDVNVIGMNLLSRLASWRVEGQTLILVPNNPQDDLVRVGE